MKDATQEGLRQALSVLAGGVAVAILSAAVLVLTACGTTPPGAHTVQAITARSPAQGVAASATLSWSPVQDVAAPLYTRIDVTGQRAKRALQRGAITRAQAVAIAQALERAYAAVGEWTTTQNPEAVARAESAITSAQGGLK